MDTALIWCHPGEVRASPAPLGIGLKEQEDGGVEWMIIAFGEGTVLVQADLSAHMLSSGFVSQAAII